MTQQDPNDYVAEDLEPTRPLTQADIDQLPDIEVMQKEAIVDE